MREHLPLILSDTEMSAKQDNIKKDNKSQLDLGEMWMDAEKIILTTNGIDEGQDAQ